MRGALLVSSVLLPLLVAGGVKSGDPVKVATGAKNFTVPPPPAVSALEKKKRELQKTTCYSEHDTATMLKSWLPDIKARFEDGHFLHWQVAFPGIWRDWDP